MLNTTLHLTCWLIVLALLFIPIEHLFELKQQSPDKRSLFADLAYYYLNGLLPTILLAVPLAALAAVVRRMTPDAYAAVVGSIPFWAAIPLGLIVAEFGSYFAHRWCHRSPYLWQFHAIHHTPDHLDWLVNTRAHPIDIVITRLGGLVPLYLFGLDKVGAGGPILPALITVIGTLLSFFAHANIRWRLGWLEHVIITPAFHHWHHTNDENRDRNFAATFPFVDRLFGTHQLPAHWPPVYGIDNPVPATVDDELFKPFAFVFRQKDGRAETGQFGDVGVGAPVAERHMADAAHR